MLGKELIGKTVRNKLTGEIGTITNVPEPIKEIEVDNPMVFVAVQFPDEPAPVPIPLALLEEQVEVILSKDIKIYGTRPVRKTLKNILATKILTGDHLLN